MALRSSPVDGFICFRCERVYPELEDAERCEARHIGIPKPERAERKAAKRKAERQHTLTRSQACALVWRREGGSDDRDARCERCHRQVSRDVAGWRDERAQFNERIPRSLGGSDTEPTNIELVCRACHYGGPSGAHAPTADRMV